MVLKKDVMVNMSYKAQNHQKSKEEKIYFHKTFLHLNINKVVN